MDDDTLNSLHSYASGDYIRIQTSKPHIERLMGTVQANKQIKQLSQETREIYK
eukprot:Pgem_evm1s17113